MLQEEKTADALQEEEKVITQQERKHLDFITAIVLAMISIVAIITSYGYYKASGSIFYESPGFMPTVVATAILLCAITLFFDSIKGSSISERAEQLLAAIPVTLKSKKALNSAMALLIFGIYVFVLLKTFPFWLASFILLCFTYFYTNASSPLKILLIAFLGILGIVLLFQVAFNVPLP